MPFINGRRQYNFLIIEIRLLMLCEKVCGSKEKVEMSQLECA